jgi:hypothetical protein
MPGFAFLSRLTQIAPPPTRFVFPGAEFVHVHGSGVWGNRS